MIVFASSNAIEKTFLSDFPGPFFSSKPGKETSVSTVTVFPSSLSRLPGAGQFERAHRHLEASVGLELDDHRLGLLAFLHLLGPSQIPTSFLAYVSSAGFPGPPVAEVPFLSQPVATIAPTRRQECEARPGTHRHGDLLQVADRVLRGRGRSKMPQDPKRVPVQFVTADPKDGGRLTAARGGGKLPVTFPSHSCPDPA